MRSREFALRGALASTTDALDAYVLTLMKYNGTLLPKEVCSALKAKQKTGLAQRIRTLQAWVDETNQQDDDWLKQATEPKGSSPADDFSLACVLCTTAVKWRNRLIHTESEGWITEEDQEFLLENEGRAANAYQGLSISSMLGRVESNGEALIPRFKEVAAFIRAAHQFVEATDSVVLRSADPKAYFISHLQRHVDGKDARVLAVWGKDESACLKRVATLCREAGFGNLDASMGASLPRTAMDEICSWTVAEARSRLGTEREGGRPS